MWRDVCFNIDGWVCGYIYVWIEMGVWRDICLNIDGWMKRCMLEYRWADGDMYV